MRSCAIAHTNDVNVRDTCKPSSMLALLKTYNCSTHPHLTHVTAITLWARDISSPTGIPDADMGLHSTLAWCCILQFAFMWVWSRPLAGHTADMLLPSCSQ